MHKYQLGCPYGWLTWAMQINLAISSINSQLPLSPPALGPARRCRQFLIKVNQNAWTTAGLKAELKARRMAAYTKLTDAEKGLNGRRVTN